MEKLCYILQEWFEYQIPPFIERGFPYPLLDSNLILSLAGVRRSGKTYLAYQLVKRLRMDIPPSNIVYINFEDDRLYPLTGEELRLLLEVYRQNFTYDTEKRIYLLLDEIQNIPLWENTLRRWHDKEKDLRLIITGSSSKLLSTEISTALRGRTMTYRVFPFSFKEFLDAKGVDFEVRDLKYSPKRDLIIKGLKEYMEFGGFPQVVLERNKTEILREYYRAILYRDIVERYRIKNLRVFENFLKVLTQGISSLFSYGRTLNLFKSMGFKISKNTLIEYMRYIESSFFAFEVPIFSYTIKDQLQYPRKVYVIDTGLRNAVSFRTSGDFGRLAENIVFLELKRRDKEIYYWKDSQNLEVDFLIKEGTKVAGLIQVCWDIKDERMKKREVKAMLKAMEEFRVKEGLVITEDYEAIEEIDGRGIAFIPLWQWLLGAEPLS